MRQLQGQNERLLQQLTELTDEVTEFRGTLSEAERRASEPQPPIVIGRNIPSDRVQATARRTAAEEAEASWAIVNERTEAEEAEAIWLGLEARRKGWHCLSVFDGNHEGLEALIRERLNDPGSMQTIETWIAPVDAYGNHPIQLDFTAKNTTDPLLPGRVRYSAHGWVSPATCEARLTLVIPVSPADD